MASSPHSGKIQSGCHNFRHRFIDDTIIGGNPIVQQTLPSVYAYVPLRYIIPLYFVFATLFISLGVHMLLSNISSTVRYEYGSIHNYQYIPTNPAVNINQGILPFYTSDGKVYPQGTLTTVPFTLRRKLSAPIYVYYRLSKVYQNYRAFNDGKSPLQLFGKPRSSWGSSIEKCEPYAHPGFVNGQENLSIKVIRDPPTSLGGSNLTRTTMGTPNSSTRIYEKDDLHPHDSDFPSSDSSFELNAGEFVYNPCGSFPWAMFNDTFNLIQLNNESSGGEESVLNLICNFSAFDAKGNPIPMEANSSRLVNYTFGKKNVVLANRNGTVINQCSKKGISMPADVNVLYRKLRTDERTWSRRYPYTTSNDFLQNGWYLNEAGHSLPDTEDLDFQVWMHTALLPTFIKLYRIIDVDLLPGSYQMIIEEFYDVASFKGKKYFELRDKHNKGKGSKSLAVVFIILGIVSFVLGLAFLFEQVSSTYVIGMRNLQGLQDPKRSWYVFEPSSPYFEVYNTLRMHRYVPMEDLEELRRMQSAQ